MTKEKVVEEKKIVINKNCNCGRSDAIYGLGVIGAAYYFLEHAANLNETLWGIGKAVFWPAILMYKLLTFLKF